MQKGSFFTVILLLSLAIQPIGASNRHMLVNEVLKSNNQTTLQQTANLLMLFVTTEPEEANAILTAEKAEDIAKAKTTALAILKTCSINCSLHKLQSEPKWRLKIYEESLNSLYQKIYFKLDKRFRKILYGPQKGNELPKKILFVLKTGEILLTKAEIPSKTLWQRLGNFFVSLI